LNKRRLLSVRHAAALLVVVLVVGLLLAAQPLRAGADGISSSALRGIARAVTWPFAAVSGVLHIDGARQWVLHGSGGTGEDVAQTGDGSGSSSTTVQGARPVETTSSTTVPETSTPTTSGGKPTFDAQHPLHVLVAGDSLIQEVAASLVRMSENLPMKVEYRYKVSSGLVNPNFFDWPAELKRLVGKFKPDVTVLMYGNNDHQLLTVGGQQAAIFSPEWLTEYRSRVVTMAGIPAGAGSRVLWIGMPIMRSDKFSLTARTFNQVFSGVCQDKGYWYMDTYKLLSDQAGKYSLYLPGPSGKLQAMRAIDGVHFTQAGGDLVAGQIVKLLQQHYPMQP
jgi:hypothetical protein